ncbi:MAG: hypothetical protein VKJ64_17560 [Leptolyngbyaceae bacterium]|nr:hypothetical protein [Leptolyngbyaceae bacterium]
MLSTQRWRNATPIGVSPPLFHLPCFRGPLSLHNTCFCEEVRWRNATLKEYRSICFILKRSLSIPTIFQNAIIP